MLLHQFPGAAEVEVSTAVYVDCRDVNVRSLMLWACVEAPSHRTPRWERSSNSRQQIGAVAYMAPVLAIVARPTETGQVHPRRTKLRQQPRRLGSG